MDWSQQTFAEKVSIGLRQMNRIMNGSHTSEQTFKDMVRVLQVGADEIEIHVESYGRVPPHPPELYGREKEIRRAIEKLTQFSKGAGTHGPNLLAFHGMPGIGKSSLAARLVYDDVVVRLFPDGVHWLTVGKKETTDVLGLLEDRCADFGIDKTFLEGCERKEKPGEAASERLCAWLLGKHKRILFIVDDVWDGEIGKYLTVTGGRCATIITTRSPLIVTELHVPYDGTLQPDRLNDDDAFALLEEHAPSVVAKEPDDCREVLKRLDGLPLAIVVAGRMLESKAAKGHNVKEVLDELKQTSSALLNQSVPPDVAQFLKDVDNADVVATLQMSTDELDQTTLNCFAGLGAATRRKEATFTLTRMAGGWHMPKEKAKAVVDTLIDDGLIQYAGEGVRESRYYMHDLLIQHANTLFQDDEE